MYPVRRLGSVGTAASLAAVVVSIVALGCSGNSVSDVETSATGAETSSADPEAGAPIQSTARESVPSALRDPEHPDHPEPLVELSEIRGVVPPDAIPALEDPAFELAGEADWLPAVEPVLALQIDGDARAYPLRIMTWHELVNGTVGGVPVTVSYCPLCNSAVAYDRSVGDRILDFGTSGALLHSSLVMYDRQTESLWSHYTGQAVVGHLTGAELDLIPIQTVSFEAFHRRSPRRAGAQPGHRPPPRVRREPVHRLRLQQPALPLQRRVRRPARPHSQGGGAARLAATARSSPTRS